MQKKPLKYILIIVVVALLGYKSVYFKKLDERKQTTNQKFDATGFTQKLWKEKLPAKLDSAIELSALVDQIKSNPMAAFDKYSNTMAIGNYRYSLVKTSGIVTAVNEDEVMLEVPTATGIMNVTIATEFIYGNAIRDASKLVDVRDFTNSTDLSGISEALNNTVRKEVLPPFKSAVKKGDKVVLVAAVEINKEHIKLDGLELIPVQIKILP
ncbi:MAG: DUF2291 domain-containing protein [Bacteroidota bacterium]